MTKPLKRAETKLYHYAKGERMFGQNPNMSGNCTGLWGDCTGLSGNLDDIPADARPCNMTDWVQE